MRLRGTPWEQIEGRLKEKGLSGAETYEIKKLWWEENEQDFADVPEQERVEIRDKFLGAGVSPLEAVGVRAERAGRRALAGLARAGGSLAGLVHSGAKEDLHEKAAEIISGMPEVRGKPSFIGDVAETIAAMPGEAITPIVGGLAGGAVGGPVGAAIGAGLLKGLETSGETGDVREGVKAGAMEAAITAPMTAIRPAAAVLTRNVMPGLRTAAFRGTEAGLSGLAGGAVATLTGAPSDDALRSGTAVAVLSAMTSGKHPTLKLRRPLQEPAAQNAVDPEVTPKIDPDSLVGMAKELGFSELHNIFTRVKPNADVFVRPIREGVAGQYFRNTKRIALSKDLPTMKWTDPASTLAHEMGHFDPLSVWKKEFGEVLSAKRMPDEYRAELKRVTQALRPFDETKSAEFTAYRYSDAELAADAFAAFMSDPQLMRSMAPKTFERIQGAIDENPKWSSAFQEAQNAMRAGTEVVAQRVLDRELGGYRKTREELQAKDIAKEQRYQDTLYQRLWYRLADISGPWYAALKDAYKSGRITREEREIFRNAFEQYAHIGDAQVAVMAKYQGALEKLRKAGIDGEQFSAWARFRYGATEDANKFGSQGVQGKDAEVMQQFVEAKWTPEQRKLAEEAWGEIFEARRRLVLNPLKEHGVITKDQYKLMLSRPFYVPQKPRQYAQQILGRRSAFNALKERTGHLHETTPPIETMLLQDLDFQQLIGRAQAAKALEDIGQRLYPDQVRRLGAYKNKEGRVVEQRAGDGMETITFVEDGKIRRLAVPEEWAKPLDAITANTVLASKIGSALLKLPRTVFVKYNPRFAFMQPARDIIQAGRNIYVNTPPVISEFRAFLEYIKAIPEAHRFYTKGTISRDLERMMQGKAIPTTAELQFPVTGDEMTPKLPKQMLQYLSGSPEPPTTKNALSFIGKALQYATQITEITPKIAGYRGALKEGRAQGLSGEALEAYALNAARSLAGTPNTARTAHPVMHAFLNALSPFSTAKLQGFEANTRIFREGTPTQKANAFAKLMMYSAVPKLGMALAAKTVLEDFFNKVPERAKEAAFIIPLGMTKSGEAVWFHLVPDFFSQNVGSLFWNVINDPSGFDEIVKSIEGEVPYMGLNPIFGVASAGYQLKKGILPTDNWTMQPIISETAFRSGDQELIRKEFMEWATRKLGGTLLYSFGSDNIDGVKKEVMKAFAPVPGAKEFVDAALRVSQSSVPIASSVVAGFVRASDRGLKEKFEKDVAIPERRQQAKRTAYTDHFINLYVKQDSEAPTPEMAYKAWADAKAKLGDNMPEWKQFWRRYERAWIMRYGTRRDKLMAAARSGKQRKAVDELFDAR